MTTGVLIWCVVLAFLGLNTALAVWIILRFTAGPLWAAVGFNAMLVGTIYSIIQLAS